MIHTTRAYFTEKVLPTYEIFVNYYNEREFGLRKDTFNAGNIAESLRDLPEHLFAEIGLNTGFNNAYKFREDVTKNNQCYKIVCDLANVIKHKEITRNSPSFTNLNNVRETVATIKYVDFLGKYYRTRKLLEIILDDNSVHDIGDLLHDSFVICANKLLTLGIIPSMPKVTELFPKFAKRKDPRFKVNMEMLGIEGESFQCQLRALIYKKSTNSFREIHQGEKFGTSDIPIKINVTPSPFK